jgi:hypothetical protein
MDVLATAIAVLGGLTGLSGFIISVRAVVALHGPTGARRRQTSTRFGPKRKAYAQDNGNCGVKSSVPCRTVWAPTFLPKISDRFSCEFVRP